MLHFVPCRLVFVFLVVAWLGGRTRDAGAAVAAADTRFLGLASVTCNNDIQFIGDQLNATNGFVQQIDAWMIPHGVCTCDVGAGLCL